MAIFANFAPRAAELTTRHSPLARVRIAEGTTEYTTCDNLLNTSGGDWPQSALFEIAASGVALDKLVIGKPGLSAGDANSGYIAPATLAGCLAQAKAQGWGASLRPMMFSRWLTATR